MSRLTNTQKELLSRFTSGVNRLEIIITGVSEKDMNQSLAPGEWTIRQIIHHIADDGDAWSIVIKKAIATPGAPIRFEGFPGNEAWANALSFDKRPVQASLSLIKSHRQVISELAEYFCETWNQNVTIIDSHGNEMQKLSMEQIIRMISEHLDEHINTIENIRQKHGI